MGIELGGPLMCNNYLAVLKRRPILHKTTITSCYVKLCVQNVLTIMVYFHCKIYFVVYANHENIFTAKISRSTVKPKHNTLHIN